MQVARHWRNKKLRYRLIRSERQSDRRHAILRQAKLATSLSKQQDNVEKAEVA